MNEKNKVGISVKIPIEYKELLDKIKEEEDIPVSQIIRKALKMYFDNRDKE